MMECFVGFSKDKSILARIITLGQKGRYSHAFIVYQINDNWFVSDSSRYGIKVHTLDAFSKHRNIVKKYSIESTEDQRKMIMRTTIERSFDKYPMVEIIGNACQILVKWLTFGKKKIKNPFGEGERSPRCHEFVAIVLRDIFKYPVKENLDDTDLLWLDEKLQLWLRK